MFNRRTTLLAVLAAPAVVGRRAATQAQRLRWAHVYEVNEPLSTR
jgi:hypothetical protein